MHVVTPGVVLARRTFGEYGRMAAIYTKDFGKISVRFAGVDRPQAKLKAFSEPMVWAEYRLYVRPSSPWATATGGRLVDCYPGLRKDLKRMLGGLEICELLLRLSPEHSPNPAKYELITNFLAALAESSVSPSEIPCFVIPAKAGIHTRENFLMMDPRLREGDEQRLGGSSSWLPVAFGLRLLGLSGLGPEESRVRMEDRKIYQWLLSASISELADTPEDIARLGRLRDVLYGAVEAYLQRPLNTPRVREEMRSALVVPA